MADFNALQAIINAYIKRNGVQAITGQILNGVLTGMVNALGKGYTVAGAASPTTDPGTMTGPLAYISYTAGTYTHFDNIVVEQGEVSMLIYNEAEWHKEVLFSLAAQATVDDNIGVPSVGVSFVDGILTFNFRNMKGEPGENGQDGDPAGFGTISASISGGVGNPGVSVQSSGPDTAKNIAFQFTNLKGETGVTSCVVTVDNTTGNPSCAVSLVGQELHLDFSGLKGAQGNTGSSVDYPFTIVNNLTTDDPTQALSAAMGVQLESEVSQLEANVTEKIDGFTIVDKDYVWANGYVNTSGKVVSSAASIFCQPILFKAGEMLTYKTNSTYASAVVKVANGNPIAVGDTGFVVATLINASTANETYTYQFTEDTYVVISVYSSDYTLTVTHENANSVEDEIKEIHREIDGTEKNYATGGWGQNGQNAGSTSWYRVLDYIPVSQNDVVVWNPGATNGGIALICYDSSKTQTTYFGASATTRTIVIPANVSYIRPSFAVATFSDAKIICNGKTVWLPTEYSEGIVPAITSLKQSANTYPPIGRCALRNGTLNNSANTTAVTTAVVNTCGRGLIGLNITRPNMSGYHYVFGYALTSSYEDIGSMETSHNGWHGRIEYQENIDAKTLNISGYPSAVGVAFYIAEKDNDGNTNPLRITDFEGYKVELIYFADEQVGIETQMRNYAFNSVYDTTDIDAKCKDFSAMLNNSGVVESFVFMTDPHLLGLNNTFDASTFKTYIGRLQKYYNMLPVDWMICGGDWLNNGDYQDIACWKLGYMDATMRKLFKHYFPVLGNHDTNYQGKISEDDTSRGDLTHQTLVNLMFRENGNTYYKFKGNNTQFYVFDTGIDWSTAMDSFKWGQIDWFARALVEDDAEHTVIIQHIFYTDQTIVNPMATNIQTVAGAYNSRSSVTLNGNTYDFSGCTGRIACVIAGHSHFDAIVTEDVSVPVWLTANMMKGSTPTFDLCIIDYTAGKMKAIRVGTGENREMTLA